MDYPTEQGGEFFYVLNERLKILYADDDPILREFATVHLSSETVDIETVCDGTALLAALQTSAPDLILLDLEMPNMDGFEVLRWLSSSQAHCRIPVIVVTGREDVAAIDRAYQAGATSFVVKPMNWRQLSYQIRYVHRTARNDARLLEMQQAALRDCRRASDALRAVAGEGSRFIAAAISREPGLKTPAAQFAALIYSVLDEVRQPQPANDIAAAS